MLDDSCGSLLRKNDLYLYYHVCMHWETERKKKRLGDLGVTNEPSILVIVVEREFFFFLPFSNKCRKDRRGCPPMPSATDPICPLFQVAPYSFCSRSRWNGVYLMDMKDHLAHGPFGKLTYWSSFVDFCCFFFFVLCVVCVVLQKGKR